MADSNRAPAHAWYMVILCMIAYMFSIIDRQIVTLLIEPIRADLDISDTQFSLIQGLAFALFYALMGIPIARAADSRSRPQIIAAGIFIWSLATAVCGISRTFWQLFVARMAVGFGEAALSPSTYSMITDAFPRPQLGIALSIYSTGAFVGGGLAYIIGGMAIDALTAIGNVDLPLVGVLKPWQMTFFIVGLPGVVLALLFFFSVRDPERKGDSDRQAYTLAEIGSYLRQHARSFASHYLAFGLLSLVVFAVQFWSPALMYRKFGLGAGEAGRYLGMVFLVSSVCGTLTSGWLIDRLTKQGKTDAPVRVGIISGVCSFSPIAVMAFLPTLELTLVALAITMFFASFAMTPAAATIQLMAPNRMRAQLTALFFLALNIVGITGGATLVALATDYLFVGDHYVAYSLSLVCTISALAGSSILYRSLHSFRLTINSQTALH